MKNKILAKRYARALLVLGREDGHFNQYGQELANLAEAFKNLGPESKVLTAPCFTHEFRAEVLNKILKKAALSPMVDKFIRLLLEKGRFNDLEAVAEAYRELLDAENDMIRGRLTTPGPLSPEQAGAIEAALSKFAGKKVNLTVIEDPSIIGGLMAQLGDLTIDGSIRTQLGKLARTLSQE